MYDLIIVGSGTAGITAYKEAIKHTDNILIINAGPWDTTCARVGCMPSKVLIASANRMHLIQHAHDLALNIDSEVTPNNVMSRVRELRDFFTQATLKEVNQWNPKHKISGHAKFVDAQTVEVDGQYYQAKSFILAVGSRPNIDSKQKEVLGERLLSSNEVFELPTLPESLAVIGSGVIAVELAQAMQRLGVKTTIFARSQKVGSLTSPVLQELAQQQLSSELEIKFKTVPDEMIRQGDQVQIKFKQNDQPETLKVDYVLTATGRSSNLDQLELEKIDPSYTDIKNLPIDLSTKQLANYPIFIIGDAAPDAPIQHEAAYAGKKIVKNCLNYPDVQAIPKLTPLAIVFSQPEMAIIGKNYQQLKKAKTDFVTGFISYERQGRARVEATNMGGAEIYIDRSTRKLLGAELFCAQAEHLGHLLVWLIGEGVTIDQILEKPFYHPTLEEGLRTALKHARRQLADQY
ncbi:dihydrolipoyl dehydrogenase [Acinetobacter schindleri]|uniref:dihydrolipoyl dehydrogenase n=1 Tax=Acinetobacter schindleri TaxID=108981 RepID=UPI0023630462|nr:dihydrolipoyl dehydrogenase [Acinetobacter schindleri]WDE16434.1 dihydrolipoyl dehydrogenase [Acinetobacter schindleri]